MWQFAEIVNYIINRNESKDKDSKEEDLSDLEYIGFATGFKMIERLTKEMPRFKDELDTMKFICTDFWTAIYKKQIDNLRTNHQGRQYLEMAPRYVAFTCGVVRGSLANLGINCLVTAEVQAMPLCKFHIQVQRT
ncbi:Transport protein particle (TRAPP) component [Popillia japonica]|uniref:Transport protein particle (TRAPP) component n=1 Tax=Popillia japonica TaxID=7064 RepID=A0AAW1JH12_POPJA